MFLMMGSLSIIDPVPPSAGFAPTRNDGMDMKALALVEELNRLPFWGEYSWNDWNGWGLWGMG
jgi:hypothetical protein